MTADEPPPSLEDLDRRLREARGTQEREEAASSRTSSIGQALRLATEMASALFVKQPHARLLTRETRP